MSESAIRLRHDAGHGAVIAFLQAAHAPPSPAAAALAQEFRVQIYAVAPEATVADLRKALAAGAPLGVVASTLTARLAFDLARAEPAAVSALALLAPPADALPWVGATALAGFETPVLALFGARGAGRLPPAARVLRQAITNCHAMFVYDAGDDMDSERPEAVAAALGEFMRTRERYLVTTRSAKLYP